MRKDQLKRSIFKKLLRESMESKAQEVLEKIMNMKDINPDNEFDYTAESKMCNECGLGEMVEGECNECGYSKMSMEEEKTLSRKQKNIAKLAEPEDEIDAEDLKVLRSKKRKDMKESEDMDFYKDSDIMGGEVHSNRSRKHDDDEEIMYELEMEREIDESDVWEGNEFSGELNKARERGDEYFTVDDRKYKVRNESSEKFIQKDSSKWGKKELKVILENGVKDKI